MIVVQEKFTLFRGVLLNVAMAHDLIKKLSRIHELDSEAQESFSGLLTVNLRLLKDADYGRHFESEMKIYEAKK